MLSWVKPGVGKTIIYAMSADNATKRCSESGRLAADGEDKRQRTAASLCPVLSVDSAVDILRKGETVAFPTETVFGLGADARNGDAVAKIFEAKGRPSDNPLIVHVGCMEQISFVETIPEVARKIGERFWPGPLSIVFKHRAGICERVRAGLDTVAVRIPSHPVAVQLLKAAAIPVAAPSANISGKPSPTCTRHVQQDFGDRIGGVVEGQSCDVGVESTVIKIDDGHKPCVTILRPGAITIMMLEAVVGEGNVQLDAHLSNQSARPLAPGMKYRHYAPEAPMLCVEGQDDFFRSVVESALQKHSKVGVLITRENASRAFFEEHPGIVVADLGSRGDVEELCKNLFFCLRVLDDSAIAQIFSETVEQDGVGLAFMNRLLKAASNNVLKQSPAAG